MYSSIKAMVKKHWDLISYMLFGMLTTLVNYLVYLPCYNLLGFSAVASNSIAWAASVIFAFLTNKPFVFQSHDWSWQVTVPEFVKFVGCRMGSGLLETAAMWSLVDWLGFDGNVMKLIVSCFIVILNYIGSKLLVFKK